MAKSPRNGSSGDDELGLGVFINWLMVLPRPVAILLALLVSSCAFFFGAYFSETLTNFSIVLYVFGGCVTFTGVALVFAPQWEKALPRASGEALGTPLEAGQLTEQLAAIAYPYYICTRCQLLFQAGECHGQCAQCERVVDCHHIESDDDKALILTSMDV